MSQEQRLKPLRMVAPDHRMIGCAKCGSHDVGGANKTAYCHNCNQTVRGENLQQAILLWNNAQLGALSKAKETSEVISATEQPASTNDTKSLDTEYFRVKLNLVVRDLNLYTPIELFTELTRLANAAKP